jgi:Zn-dependent protease with chaperone function
MAANGTASPDYSILAAFNGSIQRPKTGMLYHCCLFLVAGAMLVLPLIYFAMLVALAWAIYFHAIHDWLPIMSFGGLTGGGIIIIAKFLFYFIPLFAGIVVLFFMLKPLLAGQPKQAQPLAMNPADDPLLYAFISRICDIVGAPAPSRIDMDCRLNASASFRRGFRSMTSNDLVLTIGLPLVANFSARELAGVIAHEFGHFTQGAGMRLSYIIRRINFWFARVAYQRDAWDEALEKWSNEEQDIRAAMVVWSAQIAVWFSRLILKLLMFIGLFIAGFMLRQMEYNADAYQIQVVGSDTFEKTHRKLATLEAAMEQAGQRIYAQWKKTRQLPDNLSELLRQTHENLPDGVIQKVDDMLGFHRAGILDSHPSPAARIRRGRMAGEPGIFHDDRPASSLFASFEHPARFVTLLHYTDNLGIPITNRMLLRVESTQPEAAQGYAAAAGTKSTGDEFYLGVLPLLLPLRIAPSVPSTNYETDITELNQLSTSVHQVAAQLTPMAKQYEEAAMKLIEVRTALRLLDAGFSVRPESFGLAIATIQSVQAAEIEAAATCDNLRSSLREIATALNRRMQLALSIRLSDKGESGADFVSPERVSELLSFLNQAADDYSKRRELADALAVLDRLETVAKVEGEAPALSKALENQKHAVGLLTEVPAAETNDDASKPKLQLARQQKHLAPGDLADLRQGSAEWFSNYQKTVDELAEIASAVEKISI